jgi:hypothetical protein psyrptA_01875
MIYLQALLCAIGIATGQVLSKLAASALDDTGSWFSPHTVGRMVATLSLMGVMTIFWIWVLQTAELGRVYPIMALAFVIVPAATHVLLGERFTPRYFTGIVLIMTGIVVTVGA